jgi:hypothetical protein
MRGMSNQVAADTGEQASESLTATALEVTFRAETEFEHESAKDVVQLVHDAVALAELVAVTDRESAEHAATVLTRLAREKRAVEEARTAIVKPLNDHVNEVNAWFKGPANALKAADDIVRGKVLAYNREAERLRRAEEARLHAEREAAERLAREEREQAERVAREAEERRASLASAAATAQELAISRATDSALIDIVFDAEPDADQKRIELAQRELARRRSVRQAEAAAEAARAAEEATRAAPMQAVAPVERHAGIATRTTWKGTVTDESLVPREYLVVDQRLINAAVKQGVRTIPGVRIAPEQGLAVSTR